MFKQEEIFSILLVSGECFKIYKVIKSGSHVDFILLDSRDIRLQKHFKVGGQSAPRFQRIVKSERESYVKKVVEHLINSLTCDGLPIIKGILLAGPADFKNRIRDDTDFKQYFDNICLGTIDTAEIDNNLVSQVYEINNSVFNSQQDIKKELNKIKEMMTLCDDKIMIGFEEAKIHLENCRVKKLFITNNLSNEKKDIIKKLNTYDCNIQFVDDYLINKLGVDIIGVLYY